MMKVGDGKRELIDGREGNGDGGRGALGVPQSPAPSPRPPQPQSLAGGKNKILQGTYGGKNSSE